MNTGKTLCPLELTLWAIYHGPAAAGFTYSNVHRVCEACSAIISVMLTKKHDRRYLKQNSWVDQAVGSAVAGVERADLWGQDCGQEQRVWTEKTRLPYHIDPFYSTGR